MTQSLKDSFLDLERHRELLQKNVESLQKTLRHWQLWEAEYEGLKEEILAARSAPPSREELLSICAQYDGELVTKKEVNDILGVSTPRTPAQVVNVLEKRIDYVVQNVRSLQKQVEAAEKKLAVATIISTPEVRNEEGLPLTEILEELDEDGNIISSHLSTPGSSKPALMEVLQKAGVKDLPISDPSPLHEGKALDSLVEDEAQDLRRDVSGTKKAVTFSEDVKGGLELEESQAGKRVEEIMSISRQQENKPSEPPIIPTNESAEDAALRREMLQYGMSEVGSVVAELDLEDGSDWSGEDVDEDELSASDEEDAFGRSTRRLVDEELRQQMIELEKRLGVQVMHNIGKGASDYDTVEEGIGRVTINNQEVPGVKENEASATSEEASESIATGRSSSKKSVRFADGLDISSAPKPPIETPTVIKMAPISDIVERTAPADAVTSSLRKKASRFNTARGNSVVNGPLAGLSQGNPALSLHAARPSSPKPFSNSIQFSPVEDYTRSVPTGPEGRTLANTVVEREAPTNASAAEPDEMDPHLLHQEVATEYHRMRNMMIQRQGGFLKEEESEIVPFTEEEGGPKRVSRFKAARLARS